MKIKQIIGSILLVGFVMVIGKIMFFPGTTELAMHQDKNSIFPALIFGLAGAILFVSERNKSAA